MCAPVVAEIPDHDHSASIGADELTLIGMNDHIVHRMVVSIVSLDKT